MAIRIQTIHFTADKKLIDFAEKKIGKLTNLFDIILDVDVYLKFDSANSQIKDKAAELKVAVPGTTLFASETSKTFETAIDEAVSSMKRQLKKHKDKLKN